jgi:hypothetical protein
MILLLLVVAAFGWMLRGEVPPVALAGGAVVVVAIAAGVRASDPGAFRVGVAFSAGCACGAATSLGYVEGAGLPLWVGIVATAVALTVAPLALAHGQ